MIEWLKLKFTPLEFETQAREILARKKELKFTPLEFETTLNICNKGD